HTTSDRDWSSDVCSSDLNYFRECSLVVMSSVWPEPFGMAGIEAMRYGLPVVAFDAGGIREWLLDGHNGYLVPWMDRATYAARVEIGRASCREICQCVRFH